MFCVPKVEVIVDPSFDRICSSSSFSVVVLTVVVLAVVAVVVGVVAGAVVTTARVSTVEETKTSSFPFVVAGVINSKSKSNAATTQMRNAKKSMNFMINV
jgi:hypothetical protein